MQLEQRIREAEGSLFARYDLKFDESFIELPTSNLRLRVLSVGAGPDLVMLHGVSLAAAIWSPWLGELKRYRAHLVELPGHGLSDPVAYRVGAVREHSVTPVGQNQSLHPWLLRVFAPCDYAGDMEPVRWPYCV